MFELLAILYIIKLYARNNIFIIIILISVFCLNCLTFEQLQNIEIK